MVTPAEPALPAQPAHPAAAAAATHRYVALDSLRGIAALAVTVFHLPVREGFAAWPFFRASNQFVDFFFVLSGFVIAASYGERLARGFPIGTFLWLRLGRIWPVHFVILVVYVVIEIVLALTGTSHGGRVPFTGTREPWALIPTALLVQAFVMPNVGTWNAQSWSISVELGLYVVWACAWRALGRLAAPLAFAVAVLLLVVWEVKPEVIDVQVWAMRGFAGFGLGIGVRAIERRLASRAQDMPFGVATAIEAAMLVGLVLVVRSTTPLYLSDALFVGLVLVFAFGRGWFAQALGAAPFVLLGTISYSLYMVHGFVIGRALDVLTLAQRWAGTRLVEHPAGVMGLLVTPRWASDALTLVIVAMAIALAWLAWRWIEEPCRQWSRNRVASTA